MFCGLIMSGLCWAAGSVFAGLGRFCRHKGPGDGRGALTIVCTLLTTVGLSPVLLKEAAWRTGIVVRFPAIDVYGIPVAFSTLADPTGFVWAAVPRDGQSVHMFKAGLNGAVEADVQLTAPQFIGSLKSPRARFDASAALLVAGTPGGIVVWNHRTGAIVWSLDGSERAQVTAAALSPCRPILVYATAEPVNVHLVDIEKPVESSALRLRTTGLVSSFSFSPDGKLLIVGTGDPNREDRAVGNGIAVIDVPQRNLKGVIDVRAAYDGYLRHSGPHDTGITSVALHMGRLDDTPPSVLATMNRVENEVTYWDLDGGMTVIGLWSSSLKTACHFSADGCGLAIGDASGDVSVRAAAPYDGFPDEARTTLVARSIQPVRLLRFLPDSNHLAANEFVLQVGAILDWGNPFRSKGPGIQHE